MPEGFQERRPEVTHQIPESSLSQHVYVDPFDGISWRAIRGAQLRMRSQSHIVRKQHQVLPVPPPDARVVPDSWSNRVNHSEATGIEELSPVFGPLFVDVACSALSGKRR